MNLLRRPVFLAMCLGHFMVDVLNGQTGILLAVLSVPLRMSNATIGLAATIFALVGAMGQPVFGWLADRYGPRWATAGGVLWMAFFFSLVAVAPGYWPIVFLVLGALGSAAFHPPATMKAAQIGNLHMAGQVATAASIFFLFGQGGLSVGPAVGGLILDTLGRGGLLLLTGLTVPVGLVIAWQLRSLQPASAAASRAASVPHAPPPADPVVAPELAVFILVITLAGVRTCASTVMTTFAPKFFQDQGVSPAVYGVIVGLFMGGSAIGGVCGGILGDRWGRRRTITSTLALSIVPFFFLPLASGAWVYLLAALAGLLNGAPHSILVTMAQRALPGRAAFASGLTLGLMFTAGALGAYVGGLVADDVGLHAVLQANALLAALAVMISLGLRAEKRVPVPATAGD